MEEKVLKLIIEIEKLPFTYSDIMKIAGYSAMELRFTPNPTQKDLDDNFIYGFILGYIKKRDDDNE